MDDFVAILAMYDGLKSIGKGAVLHELGCGHTGRYHCTVYERTWAQELSTRLGAPLYQPHDYCLKSNERNCFVFREAQVPQTSLTPPTNSATVEERAKRCADCEGNRRCIDISPRHILLSTLSKHAVLLKSTEASMTGSGPLLLGLGQIRVTRSTRVQRGRRHAGW